MPRRARPATSALAEFTRAWPKVKQAIDAGVLTPHSAASILGVDPPDAAPVADALTQVVGPPTSGRSRPARASRTSENE
jgi:hypothetical protein